MVTLRPTTRVAVILGVLALVLGLGELLPSLVGPALALDGALALFWMADVIVGGRLGFAQRRTP